MEQNGYKKTDWELWGGILLVVVVIWGSSTLFKSHYTPTPTPPVKIEIKK